MNSMVSKIKASTILMAGSIAGALDILAAIITYAVIMKGTTVEKILQSISAGLLGRDAFTGGWSTALLGLLLHFCIAIAFAAIYMGLYPIWKRFFGNPAIAGICYGCIVWTIMNFVVVPNATGRQVGDDPFKIFISIGLIILFIGLPIAIITDKRLMRAT